MTGKGARACLILRSWRKLTNGRAFPDQVARHPPLAPIRVQWCIASLRPGTKGPLDRGVHLLLVQRKQLNNTACSFPWFLATLIIVHLGCVCACCLEENIFQDCGKAEWELRWGNWSRQCAGIAGGGRCHLMSHPGRGASGTGYPQSMSPQRQLLPPGAKTPRENSIYFVFKIIEL